MLTKFVYFATVALSVLSVTDQVLGRERWLERDNKPVLLHPRRFGQENPEVLQRIAAACPGEGCGTLAGQGPGVLLAAAGECAQQDLADDIIGMFLDYEGRVNSNSTIAFRRCSAI